MSKVIEDDLIKEEPIELDPDVVSAFITAELDNQSKQQRMLAASNQERWRKSWKKQNQLATDILKKPQATLVT